ncbi:hypothetical protein [Paracandidimonas lactea]|uniref:hypothetical protein n=1 Tax=Paracandidimonas lactea TaxID=2895524 RepID=UPI001F4294C5|nr:hypothetical protein [Paracandidimonas lactea]
MKVVAGDFPITVPSWASSDCFIFGDRKKGETVLYVHIEEIELQEETKKGSLVKIRFLDGRRLLTQLTEDEYLRIRGALFDVQEDLDSRRADAVARSDSYKLYVQKRLLRQKRIKQIALVGALAIVGYGVLSPSSEEAAPAPSSPAASSTSAAIAAPKDSATSAQSATPVAPVKDLRPAPAEPKGVIADGAIQKITKAQYPKTFKQWGQKGVDRINSLTPAAAQLVIDSGTCDSLELIELSGRSKPPSSIVFFADCKNGNRFYVSDADIKASQKLMSKNETTSKYSDSAMTEMCTKSIRSGLQFPSTFDANFGGTTVYRAPGGNVVVNIDFEAKNGLGNVLPHRGRCVFDDRGMSPPEISPR